MHPQHHTWAKTVLVVLTFGEICCIYWGLFSLWKLAYLTTNLDVWRVRFHMWLAAGILIGLCWIGLMVWLYRAKQKLQNG